VKQKKARQEIENDGERTKTLEDLIQHPTDSFMGWRDRGSYVCMR
jgi:hypothetical protein